MDLYLLLKIVIGLGVALALISVGSATITLSRAPAYRTVGLVVSVPGRPDQTVSLDSDDPVLAELANAHPDLALRPPALPAPSLQKSRQVAWGRIVLFGTFASSIGASAAFPEIGTLARVIISFGSVGVTALGELFGAASNHRGEGNSRAESLRWAGSTIREIFNVSTKTRIGKGG